MDVLPDDNADKLWAGKIEPEGRIWSVQIIKGTSLPPDAEVTAVAVVACLDNKILFVKNKRGWDIPGGHIEKTDKTHEHAARRELREEACAECGRLRPAGFMISDFYPDRKTYIIIFKTQVTSLLEFKPRHETIKRRLMLPEECIKHYYGNPMLMEKLIRVALKK